MREDVKKLRGQKLVLSHNQVKSLVQLLTIAVTSFLMAQTQIHNFEVSYQKLFKITLLDNSHFLSLSAQIVDFCVFFISFITLTGHTVNSRHT